MTILKKVIKENYLARIIIASLFLLVFNFYSAANVSAATAQQPPGTTVTEFNLVASTTNPIAFFLEFLPPNTELQAQITLSPASSGTISETQPVPFTSSASGTATISATLLTGAAAVTGGTLSIVATDPEDPTGHPLAFGIWDLNITVPTPIATFGNSSGNPLPDNRVTIVKSDFASLTLSGTGFTPLVPVDVFISSTIGIFDSFNNNVSVDSEGAWSLDFIASVGSGIPTGPTPISAVVNDQSGSTITTASMTADIVDPVVPPSLGFTVAGNSASGILTVHAGSNLTIGVSGENFDDNAGETLTGTLNVAPASDITLTTGSFGASVDVEGGFADAFVALAIGNAAEPTTRSATITMRDGGGVAVGSGSLSLALVAAAEASFSPASVDLEQGNSLTASLGTNNLISGREYTLALNTSSDDIEATTLTTTIIGTGSAQSTSVSIEAAEFAPIGSSPTATATITDTVTGEVVATAIVTANIVSSGVSPVASLTPDSLTVTAGTAANVAALVSNLVPGVEYLITSSSDNTDLEILPPSTIETADGSGEISTTLAFGASLTSSGAQGIIATASVRPASNPTGTPVATATATVEIVAAQAAIEVLDAGGEPISNIGLVAGGGQECVNVSGSGLVNQVGGNVTLSSSANAGISVSPATTLLAVDMNGESGSQVVCVQADQSLPSGPYSLINTILDGSEILTSLGTTITVSEPVTGPTVIFRDKKTGKELEGPIITQEFGSDVIEVGFRALGITGNSISVEAQLTGLTGSTVSPSISEVAYDANEQESEFFELTLASGSAGSTAGAVSISGLGALGIFVSDEGGTSIEDFSKSVEIVDSIAVPAIDGAPVSAIGATPASSVAIQLIGDDYSAGRTTSISFGILPEGFSASPLEVNTTSDSQGKFVSPEIGLIVGSGVEAGNYTVIANIDQECNRVQEVEMPIQIAIGTPPFFPPLFTFYDENKDEIPNGNVTVVQGETQEILVHPQNIGNIASLPDLLTGSVVTSSSAQISFVPVAATILYPDDLFIKYNVQGLAVGDGSIQTTVTDSGGVSLIQQGNAYTVLGTDPQCSDGIDNDSDGKIDLDDCGCDNAMDDDETDPAGISNTEILIDGVSVSQIDINADSTGNPIEVTLKVTGASSSSGTLDNFQAADTSVASTDFTGSTDFSFDANGEAELSFTITGNKANSSTSLAIQVTDKCGRISNTSFNINVLDLAAVNVRGPDGSSSQPFAMTPEDNRFDVSALGLNNLSSGIRYGASCNNSVVSEVIFSPSQDLDEDQDGKVETDQFVVIDALTPPGVYNFNCTTEVIDILTGQVIAEFSYDVSLDVPTPSSSSTLYGSNLQPRNFRQITVRDSLALVVDLNSISLPSADDIVYFGLAGDTLFLGEHFRSLAIGSRNHMTSVIDNAGGSVPTEFITINDLLNSSVSNIEVELVPEFNRMRSGIRFASRLEVSASASAALSGSSQIRAQFDEVQSILDEDAALRRELRNTREGRDFLNNYGRATIDLDGFQAGLPLLF